MADGRDKAGALSHTVRDILSHIEGLHAVPAAVLGPAYPLTIITAA
ncbi:hypothetical protein SNOG_15365 [Parastagonospora nodorum SN15]|uniref:Uncharacterized protein n=1 Tax=Phaeosphaeria nodorum (strain SN15 / ATCC MYA-4574 / FGSC 10173) TaxID=321614 RepID=Q0TYU7_PHANO|nr:hypothetical protein SNOG_15365 [Parastagonospora nodorum SN15]EAT77298.1 hypothetical protein SNOG_15365 [Parastagonospora nodorum SN15]